MRKLETEILLLEFVFWRKKKSTERFADHCSIQITHIQRFILMIMVIKTSIVYCELFGQLTFREFRILFFDIS